MPKQHRKGIIHYDDLGCAAGKKIRVLIAVKND